MIKKENSESIAVSSIRRLPCPSCNSVFTNRSKLINHQIEVHNSKIKHEACHKCDYKTIRKTDLSRHYLVHGGELPYSCNYCPSRFKIKSVLTEHTMRLHSGDKRYKCTKCHYKFNTSNDLRRHATIHTGEKPFECNECHSKFRLREFLRSHMRTHVGKTPYSCWICGARFTNTFAVHCHITIHDVQENLSD